LSKELVVANPAIAHLRQMPLIHEYENQQEEMVGITLQIEQ
jgi:hypothetical protein